MSEVTYYVALPFVLANDGIAAGEAVQCFNPNSAVMKAQALSRKPGNVGALAFSRSGDPATGALRCADVATAAAELLLAHAREDRPSVGVN